MKITDYRNSKCCDCIHYRFERFVYPYENTKITTAMGRCIVDKERDYGNMTTAVSKSCDRFAPYTPSYKKWDVLLCKNGGVFIIEDVNIETFPRIYRVRTIKHGGFSISEEEIVKKGMDLIWREGDRTDDSGCPEDE